MPDDMRPRRIFLLRHGVVAPNSRNRFNGLTDAPLDPYGGVQIQRAADYLESSPPVALYASPLSRAMESAAVIGRSFGLEVQTRDELREMNFGVFDGLSFTEIEQQYPEEMASFYADLADYRIPEGETMSEVQRRVWPALNAIANAQQPGSSAAVVAHGAVNRLVLARALGMQLQGVIRLGQDFGCLNIIDFHDGFAAVKGVNIRPGPTLPVEDFDL